MCFFGLASLAAHTDSSLQHTVNEVESHHHRWSPAAQIRPQSSRATENNPALAPSSVNQKLTPHGEQRDSEITANDNFKAFRKLWCNLSSLKFPL